MHPSSCTQNIQPPVLQIEILY